uniref:Uncharacterized protein n=1 Tax=Arundo donax TaxID=35708 RepID=A0A0A9D4L4_ARUDO
MEEPPPPAAVAAASSRRSPLACAAGAPPCTNPSTGLLDMKALKLLTPKEARKMPKQRQ